MKFSKWYKALYLLIALSSFYYVVHKIFAFGQWDNIDEKLINDSWPVLVLIQIALWVLNLGTETFRWQYLLSSFTKTSFYSSFKMILLGFTAGSISPMKIGEPGGKIICLKKEERATGVLTSVYGSYLNSIVLFVLAASVLPFTLSEKLIDIPGISHLSGVEYLLAAAVAFLSSYLIIYYFFRQILKQLRNTRWVIRHEFYKNFRIKRFLAVLFVTLIRVVVYNVQLYVWFIFLNIHILAGDFFLLSPLYFAVITIIPAAFLFDLGIRGSVGIFIFKAVSAGITAVLSALFFLWVINVAVPVLWGGALLILNKNNRKQEK